MAEFKKGDVVRLKSGGPLMTIQDFGDYSQSTLGIQDGVSCVWFWKDEQHQQVFDRAVLDVANQQGK